MSIAGVAAAFAGVLLSATLVQASDTKPAIGVVSLGARRVSSRRDPAPPERAERCLVECG